MDDALARINVARVPPFGFTRDDLPLAYTADLLDQISSALENGRGMIRQRGLPAEDGRITLSRARARSTGPLRWHTDRCDVIALLCVRNAKAGGMSKLTSIVTIYNQILRRRPDLLELLCQDDWRARPTDEDGSTSSRDFALLVVRVQDSSLTFHYTRTYVEQAPEFPEVPRITTARNEALDLLAEVAEVSLPSFAVCSWRHPVADRQHHLSWPHCLRG